jgi:hypothetical protein
MRGKKTGTPVAAMTTLDVIKVPILENDHPQKRAEPNLSRVETVYAWSRGRPAMMGSLAMRLSYMSAMTSYTALESCSGREYIASAIVKEMARPNGEKRGNPNKYTMGPMYML